MLKKGLISVLVMLLMLVIISCGSSSDSGSGTEKVSHLDRVLENEVIRVAMIPDNPGWSVMSSNGEWVGYDADVARLIADSLGVKIEHVVTDGAGRIPLIQTDKVDLVVSCFTATNERAKSVGFTIPYATSGILPLCRVDNKLDSWDDLKNARISVARGSTNDFFASETFPNAEIVRFDSIADAFLALQTGKVDALFEEDTAVSDLSKKNPDTIPMDVEIRASSYICMGLDPEDQVWRNYINHVVQNALNSGELNIAYAKSFNRSLPDMVIY